MINLDAKQQRIASTTYAIGYAAALPALREVAMQHGYCMAVHGSMSTDLDLLCVAWIPKASDPYVLIEAIRACIDGDIVATPETDPKPHGRLAWNILPKRYADVREKQWVPWLDISVIPPRETTK